MITYYIFLAFFLYCTVIICIKVSQFKYIIIYSLFGSYYLLIQSYFSYGLQLDDPKSVNGHMTCKVLSTYVGAQNATFILAEDFGRSLANRNAYVVTWLNKIAMFRSYAGLEINLPTTNIN